MHKHIGARQQQRLWVFDVHLDSQCARKGIDSVGASSDRSGELLPRVSVGGNTYRAYGLENVLVNLGHRNEYPQPIDGTQMKQFLRSGILSCLNQITNVGISGRNDAIQRGIDFLEALQLLQAPDVCLLRGKYSPPGIQIAGGLIRLLLRDSVLLQQLLLALG